MSAAASAITMYDSTNPSAIPSNAQLVASYVDGYGGYPAAVAIFGAAKVVSISVGNNDADVADVETGAMTPAELPGWIARQVARGVARPVVYCNESTWPAVKAAVGNLNVSYWIANPGGSGVITGADAVQNVWEGSWDSSEVQPTFPFYPGAVTPPPPVTPPASPTLSIGATGAAVVTAQTELNAWGASPALIEDGVFGALTLTAVEQFQTAHGLTVDGVIGASTLAVLSTSPPSPSAATYGPPLDISTGFPVTVNLYWTPPAPVAGLPPVPAEYVVWAYANSVATANLVEGFPVIVTTNSASLILNHSTPYVVNVSAAGANGANLAPNTFISTTFTP